MTTVEIRNPEGTELLGEVELTDPGDVAGIVARAVAARRAWTELPIGRRADLLDAAAALLEPEVESLGRLLASESGKPIGQATNEVRGGLHFLRGNAAEGRRLVGRMLPSESNARSEWDLAFTRREPLGVVAAILPFNFPVELFVEKCAAALVGGNAVVVKPPLEDPLVVGRFREALIEVGVPADVIGAVHGGADVGAALAVAPGDRRDFPDRLDRGRHRRRPGHRREAPLPPSRTRRKQRLADPRGRGHRPGRGRDAARPGADERPGLLGQQAGDRPPLAPRRTGHTDDRRGRGPEGRGRGRGRDRRSAR